jgi:hypothetical protein
VLLLAYGSSSISFLLHQSIYVKTEDNKKGIELIKITVLKMKIKSAEDEGGYKCKIIYERSSL